MVIAESVPRLSCLRNGRRRTGPSAVLLVRSRDADGADVVHRVDVVRIAPDGSPRVACTAMLRRARVVRRFARR